MTTPLETYRWHREHIKPEVLVARPFIEVFDHAEALRQALQAEQQARFAAEQDCQHWWELFEESHTLNDDLVGTQVKQEIRIWELLKLCLDCWLQFSYLRVDYSRHAGGHSTLEALEVELREAGLIDEKGRQRRARSEPDARS